MARRLSQQASSLKWQHVLQPFHQVPELRSRAAELQAIVMRIANLIAKADGFVAPAETAALQTIQQSIQLPPGPASSAAETRDVAAESQAVAENAVWASGEEPETPKPAEANRAQVREQRRQQVDALVGLDTVKQEIHELADRVLFHSRRRLAKLPHDKTALQFVFTGPAGTGKTLVARLLSELLYGCGGLRHGHLVEVSGFDIASRDVEGATNETKAYLRKSVGGTLLINDADALLLAENASATAARRVLRQNVAAHADRLAVVLASKRPDRLLPLLDQHPGVASLFPDRWEFPDYSTSQLGQIFQACCERSQYRVTRLAQIKVLLSFHWNLGHDRKRFGNGHGVERAFERAVSQLARRIAGISPLTKELLTTFHDKDIQIEGVPAKALAQLDNPRLAFAITCPGCGSIHLAGRDLLGIRVKCKSCRHRFVSAWGEPVD
jgi:SpoVK/Ycf46/Vps4 family AAA+-type ATPase